MNRTYTAHESGHDTVHGPVHSPYEHRTRRTERPPPFFCRYVSFFVARWQRTALDTDSILHAFLHGSHLVLALRLRLPCPRVLGAGAVGTAGAAWGAAAGAAVGGADTAGAAGGAVGWPVTAPGAAAASSVMGTGTMGAAAAAAGGATTGSVGTAGAADGVATNAPFLVVARAVDGRLGVRGDRPVEPVEDGRDRVVAGLGPAGGLLARVEAVRV